MKTLKYSLALLCCMGMACATKQSTRQDPEELQQAFKMINSVKAAYDMPYFETLISSLRGKTDEIWALRLANELAYQKELLKSITSFIVEGWDIEQNPEYLTEIVALLSEQEIRGDILGEVKKLNVESKGHIDWLHPIQYKWIIDNNTLLERARRLIVDYLEKHTISV